MKWKKFTLETTTDAVDYLGSMFDDIGIEGMEIEDNVPLTESETKGMFIDILPELPPDDGTARVSFYLDEDAEIVKGQIEAVMDDIQPDAIKIGMVNDRDTIKAIANTLKKYQGKYQHLVIDPVMVSTSGCRLMQEDALDIFISELLPLATLLTPNIPEAEILAEMKIQNAEDIKTAASAISKLGCKFVLIKGGHFDGKEKIDYLFEEGKLITSYRGLSINTRNTHGTGCTLSSAITSYLAKEMDMNTAIAMAKTYLSGAILAGKDVKIGDGNGPVNHFYEPKTLSTK